MSDDLDKFLEIRQLVRFGRHWGELTPADRVRALSSADTQHMLERLQSLKDQIASFRLRSIERTVTRSLDPLLDQLERAARNDSKQLGQRLAGRVNTVCSQLAKVIEDGFGNRMAYEAPSHAYTLGRTYLERPRSILQIPQEIYENIPEEVDHNLGEASYCLALGFDVAATFLVLICTERMAGYYFRQITGQDKAPEQWEKIKKGLGNANSPTELIDKVDQVIIRYRHKAMHGKISLNEEDIELLLRGCQDIVGWMIDELEDQGKVDIIQRW